MPPVLLACNVQAIIICNYFSAEVLVLSCLDGAGRRRETVHRCQWYPTCQCKLQAGWIYEAKLIMVEWLCFVGAIVHCYLL